MAMHGVAERKLALVGKKTNGMAEQIQCELGLSLFVGLLLAGRSVSFYPFELKKRATTNDDPPSIYYLYTLVRRPRQILDFALTLVFNHIVLTIYYSASIPTSLFFWLITLGGAAMTVIVAEQLCVKREMKEGLSVAPIQGDEITEEMELGSLLQRRD